MASQGIRTPDQRLRVFVSSTLAELADERRSVARAITALRLTPVMFELGARPQPPRDVYQAYLAQSDVFIGLYWQRYGQVAPGMQRSGLEDEFELSRALPRLMYVKEPAPDREPRLADLLSRIKQGHSYRRFRTSAELGRLVRDDLATLLSERFAATRPTVAPSPRPLPVATTPLVGREPIIHELADLIGRPDARLVTLTGPGGIGKTRLALAVGERVRDRFGSGTVLVPLAAITQAEQVLAGIARAVGADVIGSDRPLEVLVERFGDGRWLLILDNLEQVLDVARDLEALLARCPGVAILATSVTVLRLRAEHAYPVPPLPVPPDAATLPLDQLASSSAVALFMERARAVRPDFALTDANAGAVVEICRRVEGLPLAIELAAARTRLLDPDVLLRRLARSLDALGTGAVDMPERHQTLRATVEWSVHLLDDAERSLLETVAVFVDGWTIDAAADVAGLDEDRALDLIETLAQHSLIELDFTERGPRSRMLETIREFVGEQLAGRPDVGEIQRRHADHYRALVERADEPLRRGGQKEWTERLQSEAGNVGVAARWYLGHDRAPLPHLLRVMAVVWVLRERMGEVSSWAAQLLPDAGSLEPHARAELLWAVAVTGQAAGDDAAALEAIESLAPLLDDIEEPFLHAVSHLAMAWSSPIAGDVGGALREASVCLEELRRQDEPFWTGEALASLGSLEMSVGRYDGALRHLHELRDLADEVGSAWLVARSSVQRGVLATVQGRLDEASALLDDGLSESLSCHSTPLVSMCLVAFARLALAAGDPERAAVLAGAAEGLRERAGIRAWPIHRQSEAEVIAEVRDALGADRFERRFVPGSRLSQIEAVAAIREWRGAP